MQIVIDITKEDYEFIMDESESNNFNLSERIYLAILNTSTPLPKMDKWIPISERLPEEFESVLVCYRSQGGMAQAVSERFGTHTGYRWSALAGIEPIAWMPLPEPYES